MLTKHPKLHLVRGSLLLAAAAAVASDWARMLRVKQPGHQSHNRLTSRNKFEHLGVGFDMPTFEAKTVP